MSSEIQSTYEVETLVIHTLKISFLNSILSIYNYTGPTENLTQEQLQGLLFSRIVSIRFFDDPDALVFYEKDENDMMFKFIEIQIDKEDKDIASFIQKLKCNNEDTELIKEILQYFDKQTRE